MINRLKTGETKVINKVKRTVMTKTGLSTWRREQGMG